MWRLIVCVSLLCCSSEAQVTCRNENGVAVDWFIMYKVAGVGKGLPGYEYLYIDPTGASYSRNKLINSRTGVLAHTLAPMFVPTAQMSPDFGFISYNDQYPPGTATAAATYGHSKGVVLMDKTTPISTGLWLLHSTPRFPANKAAATFFPDSGADKAQTYICVTFQYNQFQNIGTHLQYIGVYAFETRTTGFHRTIIDAGNGVKLNPPIANPSQNLVSNGGVAFLSVAKQQSAVMSVGDLYFTIANGFQSNLKVQTWPHVGDVSYCVPSGQVGYKIEKINSVATQQTNWLRGIDHSKWCITTAPNTHWVCIADMNRADSQYKRRGGALCINNLAVWNTFNGLIESFEACP